MAKNILIISSSPRKHGNTELMCQSFAKGALENGHKVVEVFLNEKNINFCQGCAFCEKNPGKCSQQDDMSNIIAELIKCDVVVFASPVYFYSLSGQMKTFIDRLVTAYRLITNKEVNNAHDARVIVRAYIDRWKIEEVHRAEKVEYQYEDMRVRSLQSLNNLNTIIMMFLGFLAKLADSIDTRLLSIKILERSQSLRSELVVYLGMMARGIQDILSYAHTGIQEYKKRRRESKKEIIQEEYIEQLSLTF